MIKSLERQGIDRFNAFIVYRREDTRDLTGRIADVLSRTFGRGKLFLDVDAIPLGVDYADYIREAINNTSVIVNIVGPRWLESRDAHGRRRIDNELDFVRIELEAALNKKIPIVTVLQDGVSLPRPEMLPQSLQGLHWQRSVAISSANFERDVARLIELVRGHLNAAPSPPAPPPIGTADDARNNLGDRFFFSYSRRDEDFALQLYEDLKRVPLPVWIDQRDIPAGASWEHKVEDALRSAGALIAILSNNSVMSDSVRDEIHYALELKKVVVPVLKENCTKPLRIVRLQHIDFTSDYAGPMRKLANDLVSMTRH